MTEYRSQQENKLSINTYANQSTEIKFLQRFYVNNRLNNNSIVNKTWGFKFVGFEYLVLNAFIWQFKL